MQIISVARSISALRHTLIVSASFALMLSAALVFFLGAMVEECASCVGCWLASSSEVRKRPGILTVGFRISGGLSRRLDSAHASGITVSTSKPQLCFLTIVAARDTTRLGSLKPHYHTGPKSRPTSPRPEFQPPYPSVSLLALPNRVTPDVLRY